MSKTQKKLTIVLVYGSFLGFFLIVSLVFIYLGSTMGSVGGVLVGILFLSVTVYCLSKVAPGVKQEMEAMDRREEKESALAKISSPMKAWPGATATYVDDPTQKRIIPPESMPKFCQNLSRLSSVVIKCPKCRREFLRYVTLNIKLNNDEMDLAKRGQLSYLEALRKGFQRSGSYPSSFKCIHCGSAIVRSREPSAICTSYNRRITGEELLCCLANQCIHGSIGLKTPKKSGHR